MEPSPLSLEIVNRIKSIIQKNFNDEVFDVPLNSMFRLYVKKLLKGKCRFLYWVDYEKKEYPNPNRFGIRVHLQRTKEYTGKEYPDSEGRLDTSIAFKNSKYPCLVIQSSKDLDDYFEQLIKFTYENLVDKEKTEKKIDELNAKIEKYKKLVSA